MVKGMKQTEIGLIPEDWEVDSLKSICKNLIQGINTAIDIPEYANNGIPILKANDIIDGKINIDNCEYISETSFKKYSSRFHISKHDFLLSNIGARLGSGSIYLKDMVAVYAWNVMRLSPIKEIVDPVYFSQIINSPYFNRLMINNQSGSGMGFVPKNILQNFQIPLPPLPEQEAIAGALSDADAWIESLEQLIAKKRLIKQGAMQELLTPKEGWEVKKLGEVIEILADYTANGSFESLKNNVRYYSKKNYAVLVRTTDLDKKEFEPERFTDEIGYRFLNKTSLFGGELILANVGSIGKVFKVPKYNMPMTLAPNTYMIKLFSTFSQEYVYQWMKSGEFVTKLLAKVGSSTLMAINKNNLRDIIIPIPNTYSEQTRIATILSDMDAELEALEAQLHKARQIKQGMMQELLTGKIRFEL